MDNKTNKKNVKVLISQVTLIMLGILGTTFAVSYVLNAMNISLRTAPLSVVYEGTLTLPTTNLLPINDNTVASNTSNVMRVNFTVKGASSNPTDIPIIYDVALTNLVLDSELKSEYVKWQLTKNGSVISTGSLSPEFDIIENGRLTLTNIQQDLPSNSATADTYSFVLWISESCTGNITNCDPSLDQSNLLNKSLSGKVEVQLYTKAKVGLVRKTN